MSKKADPIEPEPKKDETPIVDDKPVPEPKKAKQVNIMDTDDAHEPPKPKKEKTAEPLDLGPVLEKLDSLAAAITPKSEPAPKKEKSDDFDGDFLGPLGNW